MIKKFVVLMIIAIISLMITTMNKVHSEETNAQTTEELWKNQILSSIEDSHYEQLVSAMVIDANTGQILIEMNEEAQFPVGGLTKLLLLYITFEEIHNIDNDITIGSEVTASSIVRKYSEQYAYWNTMDLYKDGDYELQSLIESIAVYSANDASVAISEHLKGSEKNFVEYMNERAQVMGIDSTFYNVTGLNNNEVLKRNIYSEKEEPGLEADVLNELSAKEIALLSYNLIKDYPQVIRYTSMDEVEHPMDGHIDYGSNGLLDDLKDKPIKDSYPFEYPGVFGLMTGQMDKGDNTYYSYVNYYEQDADNRFITVVCTKSDHLVEDLSREHKITRDDYDPYDRFRITTEILDFINNYEKVIINNERLLEIGETLTLPVYKGKTKNVNYEIKGDHYFYYNNLDSLELTINVKPDDQLINEKNELTAPLKKGITVGQASIEVTNINLNYITGDQKEELTYDIVLSEDVTRSNIFKLIYIEISETIANFVDWVKSLF